MKETYEFRLNTKYADLVLGGVPKNPHQLAVAVRGKVGDPIYRKTEEVERFVAQPCGEFALYSWEIKRSYTPQEVEQAQLFLIKLQYKHAAAEEFGTWYTNPRPNPDCKMDRKEIKFPTNQPSQPIFVDSENPHAL